MPARELERLAPSLHRRNFPAGASVLTAEQPGESVYVIISGSAKVHVIRPDSTEVILAVPILDPDYETERERIVLVGDLPGPVNLPSGCRFRTRCPQAVEAAAQIEPDWREIKPDHWVQACPCFT